MTHDLKPYPAMKDSGVPWLGDVPAHWETMRLKRILRPVDHRSSTGSETLLSLRRDHGVVVYAEHFSRPPQGATTVGFKLVRVGQLVVNRMQANNGLVFHSRLNGLVSPDYSVFETRVPLLMDYLSELLRTPLYRAHFRRESTGLGTGSAGFLRLYDDRLLNTMIASPPPAEQTTIVRFLAHADRRIRRYIRAKQKLIKLLEEQKHVIIHQAVTRGLDPNVRLKPSGVAWLGDVPEHWEALALKRVLRRLIDCEHKTAPAVDSSEFRVVRTTGVRFGKLRVEGTYYTSAEAFAQWTSRGTPEVEDVIFTREAPAGEACLVPPEHRVCLGQRTVLMKLNRDRYEARFLVHMIYGGPPADRIRLASRGSTVGHFNMDDIADLRVLVPPLSEQKAIVAAIADQAKPLEDAIDRAESEISLLREYRTRLITDVVTGKVDVREAAARLRDEPAAADALDEAEPQGVGDEESEGAYRDAPEEGEA